MNKSELYKLILYYDVNGERSQEYYRFVMGRYLPSLQNMGLEMIEAWSTAWGDAPNRQIGLVSRDLETMLDVLEGDAWEQLNDQLLEFVVDFEYKVVPYREGFQI